MENDHFIATIHSEANAIIPAARNGEKIEGSTIYSTSSQCWNCFKMFANAEIDSKIYLRSYRDERIFDSVRTLHTKLIDMY